MKISKLHIDQFRHLENLDFDFTYPEDFHIVEKRGKVLDKICFIGQSATGKTGLLELINEQFSFINNIYIDGKYYTEPIEIKPLNGVIIFIHDKKIIEINDENLKINEINYSKRKVEPNIVYVSKEYFKNPVKNSIIYIKSSIISEQNIDLFSKNPLDLIEKYSTQINSLSKYFKNEHNKEYIFNEQVDVILWLSFLNEILEYRKKYNQITSELINKGLLSNTKKLQEEFNKWQESNPNKIEEFANNFNPIINKLNLEVDLVNTEYAIPIKNKITDEIIPIQNTSTGTKGLLLSFLPLYKLETKDSIILIDEPERSLYPDMQMDLMEYYQNLAPQAQFIVATHSPFIAAAFEPEERFILYFDEEGKVAVRRGSSPIGDDPNDMLKNDFGVNYYNKFGEEAYKKYLILKEDLAQEKDPIKKKQLLLETVKLGDTYKF